VNASLDWLLRSSVKFRSIVITTSYTVSSVTGTTAIEVETTVDCDGDGDTRRDITVEGDIDGIRLGFLSTLEADIFGDNAIDSDSVA
jgi:hypothetical protein